MYPIAWRCWCRSSSRVIDAVRGEYADALRGILTSFDISHWVYKSIDSVNPNNMDNFSPRHDFLIFVFDIMTRDPSSGAAGSCGSRSGLEIVGFIIVIHKILCYIPFSILPPNVHDDALWK